ncbi:hypothetical protein [Kitasatospora phosalacinea]|uniref:hypothetical protein n=1 Tax=Kitasatospora phosalacinea TaxID=2065 RepID=UPI000524B9F1|nr:hypothetical protein [Kitasatospora phosalacinea]
MSSERIEQATSTATAAAGELVDALLEAGTVPARNATAILETIATLTAALQLRGSRALDLLASTHQALAEVRELLLVEADLGPAAHTGARRPAGAPEKIKRGRHAAGRARW